MSALLSRPFRQFRAAYECGSLIAAAEVLGVTQPAVTRGIKTLEEQFGLELFSRIGNTLAPTVAGDILYRYSNSIDGGIRRFEAELSDLVTARQSLLRIGIGPVWSRHATPQVLSRFSAAYPNIRLEISTDIAPALIEELRTKRLDLLIGELSGLAVERDMKKIDLWRTERTPWVRADHPLFDRASLGWADLREFPWIGHLHDQTLKVAIAREFESAGVVPPAYSAEASSLEFILAFLTRSDTIAVLSEVMADDARRRGLRRLNFNVGAPVLSASALYNAEMERIAPVRNFLGWLRATI